MNNNILFISFLEPFILTISVVSLKLRDISTKKKKNNNNNNNNNNNYKRIIIMLKIIVIIPLFAIQSAALCCIGHFRE